MDRRGLGDRFHHQFREDFALPAVKHTAAGGAVPGQPELRPLGPIFENLPGAGKGFAIRQDQFIPPGLHGHGGAIGREGEDLLEGDPAPLRGYP